VAKLGLKINIYSRGITQTGTKTFSPGWYLPLVPVGNTSRD